MVTIEKRSDTFSEYTMARLNVSSLAILALLSCVLNSPTYSQERESCLWVESNSEYIPPAQREDSEWESKCLRTNDNEKVVVIGRVISERHASGLGVACSPDPDPLDQQEFLCMTSWFRWRIAVDRTISGQEISGRISVATPKHALVLPDWLAQNELFVLTPVDSAEQRELLAADFVMYDLSVRNYCLTVDPRSLGIDAIDLNVSDDPENPVYCFTLVPQ